MRPLLEKARIPRRRFATALTLSAFGFARAARAQSDAGFDHRHTLWDELLGQAVVLAADGHSSTLRYAFVQSRRSTLAGYLAGLSAVPPSAYERWTRAQQLAFLINAYNAFTVELVLTRYPDLKSIKDLGGFLSDRSRNRFDAATGTLSVSRIFDWYRKDFEQGHQGIASLQGLFARYAEAFASTPQAQSDLRAGRYRLAHLDYDWALNDAR